MAITLVPKDFGQKEIPSASRQITRTSILLLLVYLTLLLIAGAVFLFIRLKNNNLTKNYQTLVAELKKVQDKESGLFLLKDRLSTLSQLPPIKINFLQALNIVDNLASSEEGVIITDIVSDSQKIRLTVSAVDSFALESLIKNLDQKNFSEITLESLTRSPAGDFIVDLNLTPKP